MKTFKTLLTAMLFAAFSWQGFAQLAAITSIEIAGRGVASQTSFNDSDPFTALGGGIFVWEGNLNYANPNATTGSQGFKFVVNDHLVTGTNQDWHGKLTMTAPSADLEVYDGGSSYAVYYAAHDDGHDYKWRLKQGEDGFYRITINASDVNNIKMTLDKNPTPLAETYYLYKGASLPTAQDWNELKLDATINDLAAPTTLAAANGVLKLTSTNEANQFSQLSWYKTGLGLNLTNGYTIEVKAKVTAADKTGAFNIQGYDNEGKGFRIGILNNALTELTNPFAATNVLASGLNNGDAFHIFRFAFEPSGLVTVYRDGVTVGTFSTSTFQFDNIIEDGGFEDGTYTDFLSNGILSIKDKTTDPKKVRNGQYSLEMDNNGLVTDGYTNVEAARTREIAVKPNTQYQIAITRRKTANDPYAWRDMGSFYDYDPGTVGVKGLNEDKRSDAEGHGGTHLWGSVNDRIWQIHNQDITTPAEAKTIRFEFPAWIRDGNKYNVTSSFDNFTFREKPTLSVLPAIQPVGFDPNPIIPEGITNLIYNGDFEDVTMNNDGTPYTWTLASSGDDTANEPVGYNAVWGGDVRIQDKNKPDDFNDGDEPYAHSGTKALRFSSLNDNARNIDFTVALEANKTYRFVFWHRNPKWNDWCWFFVRVGEQDPIWGHRMGDRANKWIPVDLTFTTTEEHRTLHLYSTSATHGGWYNQYFDDFTLYEIPAGTPADPALAGKTNLIANGDFEDVTINNDGTPYTWALASDATYDHSLTSNNSSYLDDDFPMAYNEMWGTWLRIQDQRKYTHTDVWGDRDDNGYDWAHSGTKALRFTFEDNWDGAQRFEFGSLNGDELPEAYQLNINFKKELEPNKTYTFVFWVKTSVWNDRGWFYVANGDVKVLAQELNNKYMNWTRQQVTFSTTAANHTLRMFTEFGGWMNFYLDDLFLYEEDTYIPVDYNSASYLAFGKSTGTSSVDAEVEYLKVFKGGAYAPGEEVFTSVIFHLNGGTGANSGVYDAGSAINLPTPEKTGYSFGGWYDNAEFTGSAVTEIPAGSGAKELWAKWTATPYTITYNVDGGTELPVGSYTIEDELVLPAATKDGYTFAGWYDNAELTGDAITAIPAGTIGNKEYWAKWTVTTYTITYHSNGGASIATDTYTIESETVTISAKPTRDGYTFDGWYDNAELTGTAVTEIPAGRYGNVDLYAKWTVVTYTITYEVNGGEAIPAGSYNIEISVTLPIPVYAKHTFLGWYDNSRFTGSPVTEIPVGSVGNITFYAKWQEGDAIDELAADALLIYPNPVKDGKLTIENLSTKGKIEIYSILGTKLGVYYATGSKTTIDVSALQAGTYLVKVDGITNKIVISD